MSKPTIKPYQITAPMACLLAAQRKFTNGCSASPQGASGRRQASSVGNIGTRRAVHALAVWAAMLSSTGILAQRLSVAWVGVWGRGQLCAPLFLGTSIRLALSSRITLQKRAAHQTPGLLMQAERRGRPGVRALPAARIIEAMGASSSFSFCWA